MTRFEQIGINYQYLARTVEEATENFARSCNICCHCSRALYNDCKRCAIEQTHNMIVANMMDGGSKDDTNIQSKTKQATRQN